MQVETSQERKETSRIEAFSDGVFAVAVTLLILTIQVPGANQTDLPHYVLSQWPFFLAYLVSFLTILVMWANHHSIFNLVSGADRGLTMVNGVLLMVITFVNYPTAIVAAALREGRYEQFAVLFYTGTLLVVTIVYNLFWRYIARHPQLLDTHVEAQAVRRISREYRFGPLYYLIALVVAAFSPLASMAITFLLAVYFSLTARIGSIHANT
jgi:uncharacterized membrane protein